MAPADQDLPHNQLLDALPEADRDSLLAGCERVELRFGRILNDVGQTLDHVHFPTRGFISLLVQVQGGTGLEVGMVGREGMLGVPLMLGQPIAPMRALVQGAGLAWRLDARTLRRELNRGRALRQVLDGYACSLLAQVARSAGCLHEHAIDQRLARWLLMSLDRAEGEPLHVTQAFMAGMLGVRRVGVTRAAAAMQRRGLIRYHRGELQVLDRSGLESIACSCYAAERLVADAAPAHASSSAVPPATLPASSPAAPPITPFFTPTNPTESTP
ncbi:Crp/Fnr family transcriptional regulator [Leptothrix discophora]|uniref:Crp/Fnr family transcriptional regulator n=1 Tax=Leptothrix discophora TaxID=89 RepID=A0ABT9G914_LEPDI|nr:Crp/Fnr family transcriptional regulator [Leptothrix discophora]MDP4302807.1 Crp/Fnr family transcriptional regulator [Leptothrix discophora]